MGAPTKAGKGRSKRVLVLGTLSLATVGAGLLFGYLYWQRMKENLDELNREVVRASEEQQALKRKIELATLELERQRTRIQEEEQAPRAQQQAAEPAAEKPVSADPSAPPEVENTRASLSEAERERLD